MLTEHQRREVIADIQANVVGRIATLRPFDQIDGDHDYVVTRVDESYGVMWGLRIDGTTTELIEPHVFPLFGDARWVVDHTRDDIPLVHDLIRNLNDLIRSTRGDYVIELAGYARNALTAIAKRASEQSLAAQLGLPITEFKRIP